MIRRHGFTLIEVMVALVVLSLVILLAVGIFAGVSHAAAEVGQGRRAFDREMNARRWLTRSLRSMEVGTPAAAAFLGDSVQMSYTSWAPVPDGWLERVPVRLAAERGALVAYSGGTPMVLMDSVRTLTIDYLLTPGAMSKWVPGWWSPSQPPLAVRFRLSPLDARRKADTLLFLIKERG